jgi:hypothetical protein
VRVSLASSRGLLGGWLIAASAPLLLDPHMIAQWHAAGLGDWSRVVLATLEILGAAMFAFERTGLAGFALLLASFVSAAVIHLHHGQAPWWLAVYAIMGAVLLYFTRRAPRAGAGAGP